MSRRGRIPALWAVAAVLSLLSVHGLAAPTAAFACGDGNAGSDGYRHCTDDFQQGDPNDTATWCGGGVTHSGYYAVAYITRGATDISYNLTFSPSPPCPNAHLVITSFETDATSNNPDGTALVVPSGQQ